jgi:hypothetical protein
VQQHEADGPPGRGVGPLLRPGTERADAAVVAGPLHHLAVHDQQRRHRMGGGVHAAEVHLGAGQRPDGGDDDRQVLRGAPGQHGVHRHDAPRHLAEARWQHRQHLVGIDVAQRFQHGVDPGCGRGDHREPVAPATLGVDPDELLRIVVGELHQQAARDGVCCHQAPVWMEVGDGRQPADRRLHF